MTALIVVATLLTSLAMFRLGRWHGLEYRYWNGCRIQISNRQATLEDFIPLIAWVENQEHLPLWRKVLRPWVPPRTRWITACGEPPAPVNLTDRP